MPECRLIVVRIDPESRPEVPRKNADIFHLTVEISFNSTVWLELSSLAVITSIVDEGLLSPARFDQIRLHKIDAHSQMEKLLHRARYLFDLGRPIKQRLANRVWG